MKKTFKILMAALLCSTSLACSSSEEKAEESYQPKLDKEISGVVNVAGHYNNFEALEAEFNAFNQYYPNVELTYTYLDNYNKIIATTLTSSEAPDIFFTYPWMTSSQENKVLFDNAENLADASLGINLSCIRQGLLYKDENGNVPIVPIYTTTYGMLVNEDIFKKENLAIPTTYSELLSACEALQKAGYPSPMMGYGDFLVYPLYFPHFCAQIQGNEKAIKELNELAPSAGEYTRKSFELAADFMSHGYVDIDACQALENDYGAVIMRFFEGDVPMMLASGNTVSGTEKRESQSEAFTASPFKYSFHPVPSTEDGGIFLNTVSMGFTVNKNSKNLDIANEFMRFLISTKELNNMAQAKRMVTPCKDMSLDTIYASFGQVDPSKVIYVSDLGLADAPDVQVRKAGLQVSLGNMTVDEAVDAFGTLE